MVFYYKSGRYPLDTQINKYLNQKRLKQSECNLKRSVKNKIFRLLSENFESVFSLHIVGSAANYLDVKGGDLDICLLFNEISPNDLYKVKQLLKCSDFAINVICIPPLNLVRFRDSETGFQTDLIINNSKPIKDAYLIRCYIKEFCILSDLIVLIKLWAQYQEINEASKQGLNSSSLALMAISCLQEDGLLPCLHEEKPYLFGNLKYLNLQRIKISNGTCPDYDGPSIDVLFLRFLKYYAKSFEFDNQGISVRLGRAISKPRSSGQNHRIFIEDPSDRTNTAKAIRSDSSFYKIEKVFTESFNQLEIGRDLSELVGQYMT
ncbi:hypothetical protein SUGI_1502140 [Cryptomeria japonica]|uniref:Polynucleotide adenylyltransferase n=1 Tax=Cryptomeria japonica TaxID=3369 RepID=A0AAD3NUQ2_CRYJA|nr:uncharacterized protein LOC131872979 [Cryptomeria japonica]GLJ59308.1 hypothetical protein SUGI_1502140 [Cryptomeria japonica]